MDIPQELFNAVFHEHVLLGREICIGLKVKVERLDSISIAISDVGSCKVTWQFLKKFTGDKITISCKHHWNPKHSWIESAFGAIERGMSLQIVDVAILDRFLPQFVERFDKALMGIKDGVSMPCWWISFEDEGCIETSSIRKCFVTLAKHIALQVNLRMRLGPYRIKNVSETLELFESFGNWFVLKELYVGNSGLSFEQFSEILAKFPHLGSMDKLEFKGNQLSESCGGPIFESLRHLTALKTLELDDNILASKGGAAVARSLQHLSLLTELSMDFTSLSAAGGTSIAEGLRHTPFLRMLILGENLLGDAGAMMLARGLRHVPALQTLMLDGNEISAAGAQAISDGLLHVNNLQTFDLRRNDLTGCLAGSFAGTRHAPGLLDLRLGLCWDCSGAWSFTEGIARLESLNVSVERLSTGPGDSGLADGLRCLASLTSLELRANEATLDGVRAVSASLRHLRSLRRLHLCLHRVHRDGCAAVAAGLRELPALRELYLDGFPAEEGVVPLARSLQFLPALVALHLSFGGTASAAGGASVPAAGPASGAALAEGLAHVPALKILRVDRAGLSSAGWTALAGALRHVTALGRLELCGNTGLSNACGAALAAGLRHVPALRHLVLGDNGLGPRGCTDLAEGLRWVPALTLLTLSFDAIGDAGAAALAERLPPAVENLTLRRCGLAGGGGAAVARGVGRLSRLASLCLALNRLGDDGATAVAEAIRAHATSLFELSLWDNDLGPAGEAAVRGSFSGSEAMLSL